MEEETPQVLLHFVPFIDTLVTEASM